jgi:nicotinate-nucleotide adenylyltransferase
MSNNLIGILGGTFDPIHFGHLRLALEVQQQLNFNEIRFVPCQSPVLDKTAQATIDQRLAMLQLALADQKNFVLDDREIKRETPSYMVDTLISLREEFPQQTMCLIIGNELFPQLLRWHRWQELLELAHFVIVTRPGFKIDLSKELTTLWQKHEIQDVKLLTTKPNGYLLTVPTTQLVISSTAIREQIAQHKSPRYLLPDSILRYIEHNKIYFK